MVYDIYFERYLEQDVMSLVSCIWIAKRLKVWKNKSEIAVFHMMDCGLNL